MAPTESDTLNEWRLANPRRPRDERVIAKLLADDPGMPKAWELLRRRGGNPIVVHVDVCKAFKAAHKEITREPAKDEARKLKAVRRLAIELKEAIELSPLPRHEARGRYLRSPCEPTVCLWLFWRESSDPGLGHGYNLGIVEILDDVAAAVDVHAASLPPRSVQRDRGDAWTPAFVRWLTFHFINRFGAQLNGVVAHIANAIAPANASTRAPASSRASRRIGAKDVQAMLKGCPPAFLAPKRITRAHKQGMHG